MIRRENGAGVQSNQQPWQREHVSTTAPDRHVARSKSLGVSELLEMKSHLEVKQQRKMSLSVKSDTACISPSKCSKQSTNLKIIDQGKSPVSVFDSTQQATIAEDATGEESTSKSRCLESLKDEHEVLAIETAEWEQEDIDLESSYLLDFGSIPRSFRISSSNFSSRSDITGPTLFEPPDETNYRVSPKRQTDSRRSLVTSPDAAPLRPQRQTSKYDLTPSMEYDGNPSSASGKQVDHCPTKPARQSSGQIVSTTVGAGRNRSDSVATQKSIDSSPCKPMRQKSVSALLKKTASERQKSLHCPSIDSSPPAKPQRKQSARSLVSSISSSDDSAANLRHHQSITLHESILEEPSSSENA